MSIKMIFGGPAVTGEFKAPDAKQALMEIDGFELMNGVDTTKMFDEETGEEITREQLIALASADSAAG